MARSIPPPFRPKLYKGCAIGGVCMIRFEHLRPRFVPQWLGTTSENAAHRVAVEWRQDGQTREGVFIPQRNTASPFNRAMGGRVFPGVFTKSSFEVDDSDGRISIRISDEYGDAVQFHGQCGAAHPATSLFPTTEEAANFFSLGATGYSLSRNGKSFEGMELRSLQWKVAPLGVHEAYSRWFADLNRFPAGSVELDCALLMRNIPHEWHSRPRFSAQAIQSNKAHSREPGVVAGVVLARA